MLSPSALTCQPLYDAAVHLSKVELLEQMFHWPASVVKSASSASDDLPGKLFHTFITPRAPADWDVPTWLSDASKRQRRSTRFASAYLLRKIVERLSATAMHQLKKVLTATSGESSASGFRGNLFEGYILNLVKVR